MKYVGLTALNQLGTRYLGRWPRLVCYRADGAAGKMRTWAAGPSWYVVKLVTLGK